MRKQMSELLDVKSLSKEMEQLVLPKGLPDRPVKVGDTWTTSETRKLGAMGEIRIDQEHRFAGWEMVDNRRVAVIETAGTTNIGNGAQLSKQAQSYQPKWSDVSIVGKIWFDPELGVIGATSVQKLTMEMTIPAPKQPKPMAMKMHMNTTTKTSLVKVSDAAAR